MKRPTDALNANAVARTRVGYCSGSHTKNREIAAEETEERQRHHERRERSAGRTPSRTRTRSMRPCPRNTRRAPCAGRAVRTATAPPAGDRRARQDRRADRCNRIAPTWSMPARAASVLTALASYTEPAHCPTIATPTRLALVTVRRRKAGAKISRSGWARRASATSPSRASCRRHWPPLHAHHGEHREQRGRGTGTSRATRRSRRSCSSGTPR